jgi:hypothetical protein
MKLKKGETLMEYLANARELQLDLKMTGHTVLNMEVAVPVLNGLSKEYTTLIKVLEPGKFELSLDAIQTKLMQREEILKLEEGKKKELKEERERDSKLNGDSQQPVNAASDVSNNKTTLRQEALGASRSMERKSKSVGASSGAARNAADNVEGNTNLNGTPQSRSNRAQRHALQEGVWVTPTSKTKQTAE